MLSGKLGKKGAKMSQSYPVRWKVVAAIASVAVLSGLVATVPFFGEPRVGSSSSGGESGGLSSTLVAIITCVVSTISTISSLWLSWRADRRQSLVRWT
jgi:hypothetical protein